METRGKEKKEGKRLIQQTTANNHEPVVHEHSILHLENLHGPNEPSTFDW